MRVAVLHGRVTESAGPEELDALIQVDTVLAALRSHGHVAESLELDLALDDAMVELRGGSIEIVFNLVEALGGKARLALLAPVLLDAEGVAYTGSPPDALLLSSNKLLGKKLLHAAGIATPPWHDAGSLRAGEEVSGGVYIVKSVWEHASAGIDDDSVLEAESAARLADAVACRLPALGGEGFAELFIDGREFDLAMVETDQGPLVLPPGEMLFEGFPAGKPRLMSYPAKWLADSYECRHTRRTFDLPEADAPLLAQLAETARRCWDLFGLRGYARIDFRVDDGGRAWVIDVNANPCLSPGGGFELGLEQAGLTLELAIQRILEAAAGRVVAEFF